MEFRPLMHDVKTMDAGLFHQHWGGLAAALSKSNDA
jgi:propionate CoA-transferase